MVKGTQILKFFFSIYAQPLLIVLSLEFPKISKSYPNIAIFYLIIPHLTESYPSPLPLPICLPSGREGMIK